ncbi:MAG: tetratricopeptide repeat protein, partial [Acidobacteria bacterium]|nr:tetratricopeptide repeat protein [Acidobacteriota bacterium]
AILRALEKDRDDRPQSALEFAAELRRAYNESYLVTARSTHDGLRQTQEMITGELEDKKDTPRLPNTNEAMIAAEAQRAAEARQAEAAQPPPEAPPAEQQVEEPHPIHEPHRTLESLQDEQAPIAAEAHRTIEDSLKESIVGYEDDALARSWIATTQPDEPAEIADAEGEMTIVPGSAHAAREELLKQSGPELAAPVRARRSGRGRWARLVVLGFLLIGIGGGIAYLGVSIYHHYTDQPQEEEQPAPGMLQPGARDAVVVNITTGTLRLAAPTGSEVFIDDVKAGTVGASKEFTTQAATGLRNVRVAANGFRLWYKDVKVSSSWTQPVTVDLKRPLTASDAADAEERVKRGDALFRAKKYEEAEVEFRELLKENSDEREAHLKLAATYRALQRYGEAITEYDTASRRDPRNAETLLALGTLYGIKEHDDSAEATLRSALKLAPKNALAHNALARVLLRRGEKLDEALSEVEQALKLKADDPNFLDTKALILLARNSLEDALKTEQRAAELNKTRDLKYKAGVAAILYRMGQRDEAAQSYRQIRQTDTNDEWDDLKRLGMLRGYSKSVLEIFAALIQRTN